MNEKRLSGIVMRITVVLLCLVLFSSHLASGMFARYTVSASEEDTARAAKYGVKIVSDSEGDPLPLINNNLNGDVEYKFRVDNSTSEVPIKYETIQISFSDCYEGDVKMSDVEDMYRNVKLNGNEPNQIITQNDRNTIFVFNVNRMLRPGSTSSDFTLTFNTYPSWTETMDDSLGDTEIKVDNRYRYPINIFVDAEQIN